MGNEVADAISGRPLEIFGVGVGSRHDLRKQKIASGPTRESEDFNRLYAAPHADSAAALRRAAALDVGVDCMLIGATARAATQLKSTWPHLSAATLSWPARIIPALLAALAAVAIFTTPGLVVLSILVVLPAAFRIWLVLSADTISCNALPNPPPVEPTEPVYSVIAPLRGEARVVDQLL